MKLSGFENHIESKILQRGNLLSKAGGVEQAREVAASLISAYPGRPALKMNYRK